MEACWANQRSTFLATLLVVLVAFSAPSCGREDEPVRRPIDSLAPEEIAMLPPDGGSEHNRLIHENSPYLLQHARNPVDWYPWGEEAFGRARNEDKPIFLSIGYSTCHWCHVMERESFENETIAKILNEHFIPIKVDREERPDIDEIYMNATQIMTGSGGWPNSVWLTPDGRPWFAGTYFPPEDRFGRRGFKKILLALAEYWATSREEVDQQAAQLSDAMQQFASGASEAGIGSLSRTPVEQAIAALRSSFDDKRGGFGGAPKFPPHGSLRLLLHEYKRTGDESLLEMVTLTLDAMAEGGIHDHVGGGFHRYSTDERWLLPHFEKMLYDNAQLSRTYVDAFLIIGDPRYRAVAEQTYDWVLREMTDEQGGFYSALDADSEGEEGKFYLWSRAEIISILGEERGDRFCRVYGVEETGNFRDPATGHAPGTSILYLPRSLDVTAEIEKMGADDLSAQLTEDRRTLLDVRERRIWPHLDDKVLTSWNGLMIGSLAYGGHHLGKPEYIAAAEKAADFILTRMRDGDRLLRSFRNDRASVAAYLDDYAFLADGLLDLHAVTGNQRYLDEAMALVSTLIKHHHDRAGGGFFFVADDHEDLLTRSKDPLDKAIPSGNGVAAGVLVRLSELTGDDKYRDLARTTLRTFVNFMERAPRGTESLILVTAEFLETAGPSDLRVEDKRVAAEISAPAETARPGDMIHLDLRIRVDEGWHINSHEPLQEYLVPTSVALVDNPVARVGDIAYPEGKSITFDFSPEPLSVYEGEIAIQVPVEIVSTATEGMIDLSFNLQIQPCDENSCSAPETLVLSVPVEVVSK